MSDHMLLHTGNAASSGAEKRLLGESALLTAYLSAAGGTATCEVWGKGAPGSPWKRMVILTLSGADSSAEYLSDGEKWYALQGRITAVGGGAEVTISAGV